MNNFKMLKNNDWKEVEVNGEMKEIPVNWEIKHISEVTKCLDNKRKALNQIERSSIKGDVPYWGANSIVDYVKGHLIDEEVVLLGEDAAPFYDKTKKVCFLSQGKIWPNNHIHVLKSLIDSRFLVSILNAVKYEKIIGTDNRPKLTQGAMNNIQFAMPTSNQQSSIATVLSKQEQIITDMETLITKLESRFTYLSDVLLSGKFRVKEVDDKAVLYKNTDWKEVEVNGQIEEIPRDWEVKELDDFLVENKKSHLKAGDLSKKDKYVAFNCSKKQTFYSCQYLVKNENLFLSTGGAASVQYFNGEASYSTDVYSISSKIHIVSVKYLYYMLSNGIDLLDNMFYGAGLKHLNKKDFKASQWIIPSTVEQNIISNILSSNEQLIGKAQNLYSIEKKKFEWLLDKLLSGKYLISDGDLK